MNVADRPTGASSDDRSSKGVLWRAPLLLQNRIRNSAKSREITQNAYLTTAAIFGELVLFRKPDGRPENAIRLVAEMNRVAGEGGELIVMDAVHERDWADTRPLLDLLRDSDVISGLREERRPELAPEMVLYAFSFTRDGSEVWNTVGEAVLDLLKCSAIRQSLLFDSQSAYQT